MTDVIRPIRGMNDILPDQAHLWAKVEATARDIFESYGYREIRVPVLERTELFKRSIGEVTDIVEKEMYAFEDRNGDQLALRPEATAGIVRAALTHGLVHNKQQKVYCIGPMFRREKPQKGRYRQFHQIDVEALGYSTPHVDAELILMSARLWRRLGLKELTLEINSLGTPDARRVYRDALSEYFEGHAEQLDGDSLRRLERSPLRILDSKNPRMAEVIAGAPSLSDYLDEESLAHFDTVQRLLTECGVEFTVNPRLVRGLDYYSRTVFEWLTTQLGAQSAVCSGGRYDGLIEHLGGRPTPAVGWALGIERLVELVSLSAQPPEPKTPLAYWVLVGPEAQSMGLAWCERLREDYPAWAMEIDGGGGSMKAQMRRADRSGAAFAVIIGEREAAASKVALKDLRQGQEQELLDFDALSARLLPAS